MPLIGRKMLAGFRNKIIETDLCEPIGNVLGKAAAGGCNPLILANDELCRHDRIEFERLDPGDRTPPELMIREILIGMATHLIASMKDNVFDS